MSSFYELVPDASNLIESQRSVGYTFETAIADVVDNSVSAFATRIDINFDNQKKYVTILDNGHGMSKSELLQAMKYGSKSIFDLRTQEDLGRFGLGLKMASFSQCRKLTVISIKEDELSGAIWDLDIVKKKNAWIVQVLNDEEIKKIHKFSELELLNSGTLVIWEKFDKLEQYADFKLNFDEALEKTENHLSLVFHRFLQDNQFDIFFNHRAIDFVDPFFVINKATQPKSSDVIFETSRNARIDIKPYIVPYQKRLSQKERHTLKKYEHNKLGPGLYIYRNRRLIAWGKWFRLVHPNELANLAKIQIDIPNTIDDLWEIDVKKSQLNIPTSLRTQLRNIITKSIGESERVYKYRGTKRNKDNLQYVFDRIEKDNKVAYYLNKDNPLIKQLQYNLSDADIELFRALLKQIEEHLPLDSIQYDLASNKEIEENEDTDDKVYEEIMLLLNNQTTEKSKKLLLNSLKFSEVYLKKTALLVRIERELND
ncbi:ATP-binding protein [Listeria monocytogenes]|nr:ATP-binding protein [Listeria monocytogenes]EIQ6174580.1 ATP-binding protein [Listeria monocytogenes]EIQ6205579.1 ATP-binding protein [Listeria monocytogenes]EIQ6218921.1 ATP-binding protein [Listeria monocytogenes]EIQ6471330.1 ATP-binding protein [Listeria monocytogenes]